MSWVAAAIGGASLIGGYLQSNAASDAASAQQRAAQQANDLQYRMFSEQRADQEPWRQAGIQALGGLQNSDFQRDFTMSDFVADPGYNFRMNEGLKAIQASASARGGGGGGTLKSLMNYGQNMASQEYSNAYNRFNEDRTRRFNRLSSLAGIGQTANSQVANAGQNYANQASSNILGAGNAQAAGYVGQANAINNGMGQGMNTWMQYQMMNKAFPIVVGGPQGGSAGQSWNNFGNIA